MVAAGIAKLQGLRLRKEPIQRGLVVSCVQGLSFLPYMPKYKISDIGVLYGMPAEKDFGEICKAFLSCSRRNKDMGRFLCHIIFKTIQPKSNSFSLGIARLYIRGQ